MAKHKVEAELEIGPRAELNMTVTMTESVKAGESLTLTLRRSELERVLEDNGFYLARKVT